METLVKPPWLDKKIRLSSCASVEKILSGLDLHTVCQEASCPNRGECFSRGQATVLILGNVCTRSCSFCAVRRGTPEGLDPGEPARVRDAVKRLALKHVVVTSVTRDDLTDGGASVFAATIELLRADCPGTTIEVLVPDFLLDHQAIETVVRAGPDVLAHNVETVPRLYPAVRRDSEYWRSCCVLRAVKKLRPSVTTKSGLMLGMGETLDEVRVVMENLRGCGVDELTLGQYLAPSSRHYPVQAYIHPDLFSSLRTQGLAMGFSSVMSGPYVRSSYRGSVS